MANDIAHFAVKSIGLSRIGGRKPCSLNDAARHNLREIQAEMGAAGHIDPRRTNANKVLAGPCTAAEVVGLAKHHLEAAGMNVATLRKDYSQALELVFSLPVGTPINVGDYFAQCLDWLRSAYGLPVLSAVIHHDEAAKHMHALLLPLKDSRYVGSEPLAKGETKRLRDDFFSRVAGPAGLKREGAKMTGLVKQAAIRLVLCECERRGLNQASPELWPLISSHIKANPVPYVEELGISREAISTELRAPASELNPKPIGIENTDTKPIGFDIEAPKDRTLSCVGIAHQVSHEGISNSRQPKPLDRKEIAKKAIDVATQKQAAKQSGAAMACIIDTVHDDGVIRVRDEYAQVMPDND